MTPSERLTRRKIRYWLFRFRTAELGGDKATGAPRALRKHYEDLDWFSGWSTFGETWDVGEKDPDKIVPLKISHEAAWDEEALAAARDLPVENGEDQASGE